MGVYYMRDHMERNVMKLILITLVSGAAGHLVMSAFIENNALHGLFGGALIAAIIILIRMDVKE